jgi:hypothetical protein
MTHLLPIAIHVFVDPSDERRGWAACAGHDDLCWYMSQLFHQPG